MTEPAANPQTAEPSAQRIAAQTAITLFLFVVIFTGMLSGAYLWTKPALEASAAEEKMKLVNEVLPGSEYDNNLLTDTLTLPASPELGLDEATSLYRARKSGQPVALVFEAQANDGYAGRIRLLIALYADGRLAGVRVTQHKETPGLGDYVEPKKDKNKAHPWILQFTQLDTNTLTDKDWKVKKDGGRFEYYAGATVTPRAVVKAVKKAVAFIAPQREQLFAQEGGKP